MQGSQLYFSYFFMMLYTLQWYRFLQELLLQYGSALLVYSTKGLWTIKATLQKAYGPSEFPCGPLSSLYKHGPSWVNTGTTLGQYRDQRVIRDNSANVLKKIWVNAGTFLGQCRDCLCQNRDHPGSEHGPFWVNTGNLLDQHRDHPGLIQKACEPSS